MKNIKMKKIFKNIIIILLLILSLIWFYITNYLNYIKHLEIKNSFIKHPENLPTKKVALNTSFWFKNFKADIYRLQTIQYIWGNAISSEYKKYLYIMLDLITELNPYFEHPYIIWQLLLPSYNERYENLSKEEQEINIEQWIKLWLKWINNFCDTKKIELIKNEINLEKLWENEKYKNPCKNYKIANYLAYIYYYYKHDPNNAALYYKVASTVENSNEGTKIMAAIMSWKWWNREKSYFMFLNIAKYLKTDDKICLELAWNLEELWNRIFIEKNAYLNWKVLNNIENLRTKSFWEFNPEDETKILSDSNCQNYVNKAIRELNLKYIEDADKKFYNVKWYNSVSAKELYDEWFINYLPVDFQQYEDYWIIYYYNNDINNYDYKMWKYSELDD